MRTTFLCSLALALLCFNAIPVQGQSTSEPPAKLWSAEWITSPTAPARGEAVLHFRKTIDLPQVPAQFLVDVSADNQFLLFVNGQRVATGPSRADLAHWRYETLDLAPFLHPGKNILAATVWNFGTHAAVAQMTDRIAFLVHGHDATSGLADTSAGWEVEQEKGIETFSTNPPDFYFAAEPGERFDAQAFDWSWASESPANNGTWTTPKALGRAALRETQDPPNNWQLVPDPLPPMEMTAVPSGKVVRATGIPLPAGFPDQPFTVPAHTKASILLARSQLITAYPVLTVSDGLGSTVHLVYAEALYDSKGQKGNRNEIEGKHILGLVDDFLPNGSSSVEFMPLAWRTWRYLQLNVETADHSLQIQSLRTWFTAFPFTEKASFQSDDPSLAPIWDIGWRTARLDAHDTYMDTPYWERLQYVGDTRIQALISYAVAGDDRLARQAIESFNNSRIPDGLTQSRYPSSLLQMIPTFSLLWVGMVHDFWLYRDDPAFVRAQLPGTRTVLDWYLRRQRSDGLLGKIPWWPFADWGKDFEDGDPPQDETGGSATITLQFVEALRDAADIEALYGDAHVAETYRNAASRAASAVFRLCWNSEYSLLADTPAQKHFSQHANILGVWLEAIPPDRAQAVMTKILSTSDPGYHPDGPVPSMTPATYYFRFYLARALDHAGLGDQYLQLLGPWREMVSLGLSTWAESPEPTRSDSHAWSAHPNYDLLTIVAGIRPAAPNFNTVLIAPHLGALHQLQAALPTPKGIVQVNYVHSASGLNAQLTLPENLSGELIYRGHHYPLHPGPQSLTLP